MIGEFKNADPAKIVYGEPQHETRPLVDPERLGVVRVVVPPERLLYSYASYTELKPSRADDAPPADPLTV